MAQAQKKIKLCKVCQSTLVDNRLMYCSKACKAVRQLEYDKKRRPAICRGCGGERPRINGKRYCDPCIELRKPIWEREGAKRKNERAKAARAAEGRSKRDKVNEAGEIWCPRCVQYLPPEQFNRNLKLSYCIECTSAYAHEYRLKIEYGITSADYEALLEFQGGRCSICNKIPRKKRLAVDHNHKTGEVRGLLCLRCNHKLLGSSGEDTVILRRAADYLENPPFRELRELPPVVTK
jgi:Recombination endonuclease VII